METWDELKAAVLAKGGRHSEHGDPKSLELLTLTVDERFIVGVSRDKHGVMRRSDIPNMDQPELTLEDAAKAFKLS